MVLEITFVLCIYKKRKRKIISNFNINLQKLKKGCKISAGMAEN